MNMAHDQAWSPSKSALTDCTFTSRGLMLFGWSYFSVDRTLPPHLRFANAHDGGPEHESQRGTLINNAFPLGCPDLESAVQLRDERGMRQAPKQGDREA
jgi:hypothetical protein